MHCLKCENEIEDSIRCPICGAPTNKYGIDDETWEESKNNEISHNAIHRSKFGYSGFLLVVLSVISILIIIGVVYYLMPFK